MSDLTTDNDWHDKEFEKELQEQSFDLLPRDKKKHLMYKDILKRILPYLGTDEGKIVLTEVMLALKMEGIIGHKLSSKDAKMVHTIKDSILIEPEKKMQALKLADQLTLKKGDEDGSKSSTTQS